MKEPYVEGPATHDGPESCTGDHEGAGEALTGAHAGRVLSRDITEFGAPTLFFQAEGDIARCASASIWRVPRGRRPQACVEPPCARTGRSSDCPRVAPRAASGRPKAALR